ncbi:MAG: hypothetical protein AAFZ09_10600, partial [Pseudomonadota bacterium]
LIETYPQSPWRDDARRIVRAKGALSASALGAREEDDVMMALDALLGRAVEARAGLARRVPLFLKVAPDLAAAEIDTIAAAALHHGLDAVIATNTTLSREGVAGPVAAEAGGLSGRPLMARSTAVLAALHLRLGDRVPMIGVGGIASAEDAYAKIRAGAVAVQLYTALAYRGLWLVHDIARGLAGLAAADGHAELAGAVGRDAAVVAADAGLAAT